LKRSVVWFHTTISNSLGMCWEPPAVELELLLCWCWNEFVQSYLLEPWKKFDNIWNTI